MAKRPFVQRAGPIPDKPLHVAERLARAPVSPSDFEEEARGCTGIFVALVFMVVAVALAASALS